MKHFKLHPKLTFESVCLYFLPMLFLIGLVFLGALVNGHFFWPMDESYIGVKYADNLLKGHFFSYSQNEPPSNANTSFIFYFVDVIVWFITTQITNTLDMATNVVVIVMLVVNLIFFAIFVKCTKKIIKFCGLHSKRAFLAALIVVTIPTVLLNFTNGMETGITIALVIFQLSLFLERKLLFFTIISVLISMHRPENVVLNFFYVIVILFFYKEYKFKKRLFSIIPIFLSFFIVPIINTFVLGDPRTTSAAKFSLVGIKNAVKTAFNFFGSAYQLTYFNPSALNSIINLISNVAASIFFALFMLVLIKIGYWFSRRGGRVKTDEINSEFMTNYIAVWKGRSPFVSIATIFCIGLIYLLSHKSGNPEFFGRYSSQGIGTIIGFIIICISSFVFIIYPKTIISIKEEFNSSIINSLICLAVTVIYCILPFSMGTVSDWARYVVPVLPLFLIAIAVCDSCFLPNKALSIIVIINILLLPVGVISYIRSTSLMNTLVRPVSLEIGEITGPTHTVAIDTAGYPSLFIKGRIVDISGLCTTRFMEAHGNFDKTLELLKKEKLDFFIAYPTDKSMYIYDSYLYRSALGENSFYEIFRSLTKPNLAIYKVDQKQW